MGTLECPNCGERIEVSRLDEPVQFVEHPALGDRPRRLAIVGGHSHWVLHRCDMSGAADATHDD